MNGESSVEILEGAAVKNGKMKSWLEGMWGQAPSTCLPTYYLLSFFFFFCGTGVERKPFIFHASVPSLSYAHPPLPALYYSFEPGPY